MAYQVLYRRFRPKSFDEIVGQDHIVPVLKNEIKTGKISHAYLFSGPRGTGKTSAAKVFARAVNCLDPKDGEACGKCAACLAEEGAEVVRDIVVFGAHPVADVLDVHDGHGTERTGEVLDERGAGRSAELAVDAGVVDRDAVEQVRGGRGRDGEDAVGALDLAGPGVHAGGDDLVRSQFLDEHADADDVRDGVHVAHLVEVDLCHRHTVNLAFRLSNQVIDLEDVCADFVR